VTQECWTKLNGWCNKKKQTEVPKSPNEKSSHKGEDLKKLFDQTII
jgi:hypothetical protein